MQWTHEFFNSLVKEMEYDNDEELELHISWIKYLHFPILFCQDDRAQSLNIILLLSKLPQFPKL